MKFVKKGVWVMLVIFAILIGLYPGFYFFTKEAFGILNQKPDELLSSMLWQIGFYTHIFFGGLSLLIGWTQFGEKFREKNRILHKTIGKVYMISVVLSSLAGVYIGFYATGGMVSSLGFISLGVFWFSVTIKGYQEIKNKKVEKHKKSMIYSYAACFSAVTLRLWLPILVMLFNDFTQVYMLVAWLCWVPNIFVALSYH
jgi:uncharacterized membrane protein